MLQVIQQVKPRRWRRCLTREPHKQLIADDGAPNRETELVETCPCADIGQQCRNVDAASPRADLDMVDPRLVAKPPAEVRY